VGLYNVFFLHLPRVIENPVKVITSDGCVGAAADVVYKVWLAAGLYIFPALCLRRLPLYPSAVTCYGVCILRMLGHRENILAVSHIGYLSLASPKMSSHPNPLFPAFYSVLLNVLPTCITTSTTKFLSSQSFFGLFSV